MERFYKWPHYVKEEIDAVKNVLQSGKVNYWTGQEGRAFEREYANYTGVKHAIALANGTVALELALRALGVGPGDEVIVTPRSFIASASSAALVGASPIFADIDTESQNITADTILPHITDRTKAIVAVHLAGWPCDMEAIMMLAEKKGIGVIEDCAQAHGARFAGRPVGSFGDMAAFSFCQDKIISTGGEGGMLLTDSEVLWKKAWAYKDHGKCYDAGRESREHEETASLRWVHESFGSNLRMTEMQAAIGRIQLRKLDDWVDRRRSNANTLIEELSSIQGLRIPIPQKHIRHAYYKFYAFLDDNSLAPHWTRESIVKKINELGVPCSTGSYSELYQEKAFVDAGFYPRRSLPNTSNLGKTSVMFVVHPTLTRRDMSKMAKIIRTVLDSALT